jgi:hypothetical protein
MGAFFIRSSEIDFKAVAEAVQRFCGVAAVIALGEAETPSVTKSAQGLD